MLLLLIGTEIQETITRVLDSLAYINITEFSIQPMFLLRAFNDSEPSQAGWVRSIISSQCRELKANEQINATEHRSNPEREFAPGKMFPRQYRKYV